MVTNSSSDGWLLPRRQTEYPGREVVPEARLHARRESTFLVLAAMFLVATSALVVLGTSRVVDLSALVAAVGLDVELPFAMLVPLGALPFAATFVASAMVYQLFGRRRAVALVSIGLVAALALAGIMRLADVIDGGDAFAPALALAACYLVAHVLHVLVFGLLRGERLFVPTALSSLLAHVAGWTAFAVALHASGGILIEPIAPPVRAALATGAAASSFACVLLFSIPAALVARALAVALRVGRNPVDEPAREPAFVPGTARPLADGSVSRRLPAAVIVEDDDARRTPPRLATPAPFSSAEMRFFTEGDALVE